MQVKDYMTPDVVTANLLDGLHQTYVRMRERNIRHMPVLGEDGKLAGIVTDRDLRRPEWLDEDLNYAKTFRLDNSLKVNQAMTSSPDSVTPDTDISDAVDILLDKRYGALPVVDPNGFIVGILSAIDALQAFRDHLKHSR